jgi:predicted Zn-dependent protease
MKRQILVACMAASCLTGLAGCATNEDLGRSQFILVGEDELAKASEQAWGETLKQGKVSPNAALRSRVEMVGLRVMIAARLTNRKWDYVVFEDERPNAFVLPGGHVGVTTGLLSLVQNDDQLAAVLGHEAAHVVAKHAAERYSQELATQAALVGAQAAAGSSSTIGRGIASYGGLGAQLGVLLPFSRKHELEADRLGVDYMVKAGFRPRESITLWKLMAAKGGTSRPEFASTHPSDASRAAALEAYITSKGW